MAGVLRSKEPDRPRRAGTTGFVMLSLAPGSLTCSSMQS
jgi:hypothetical protein